MGAAAWYFCLQISSPAIDWGLPVEAFDLVPDTDLLGYHRPSGEGVDLGAIEHQFE